LADLPAKYGLYPICILRRVNCILRGDSAFCVNFSGNQNPAICHIFQWFCSTHYIANDCEKAADSALCRHTIGTVFAVALRCGDYRREEKHAH
jgi:hypothetical protein